MCPDLRLLHAGKELARTPLRPQPYLARLPLGLGVASRDRDSGRDWAMVGCGAALRGPKLGGGRRRSQPRRRFRARAESFSSIPASARVGRGALPVPVRHRWPGLVWLRLSPTPR